MQIKHLSYFYCLLFISISFQNYAQDIKINEIMSNNLKTLSDEDQDNVDWIELYNPTSSSILLSNYFLSDNNQEPLKWQLPPISLNSNSFIIIYASDKNRIIDTNYHTNFKLSKSGSILVLTTAQNSLVESIQIPELYVDISYGKTQDGNDTWAYFQNPTPKSSNNLSVSFSCILSPPVVSKLSGSYPSPFYCSLSHSDLDINLKFTIDGSDPILNGNNYTEPLLIENINHPNNLSLIPTNPSLNFPMGDYDEVRANNRGWLSPYVDVKNVSVLKVQAFKNSCISSSVVSRTFLIQNDDNLPVLSIFVDSIDFFSNENGIYVYGNDSLGNYNRSGLMSERIANIDYFNSNNNIIFSEKVGLKISGHGSRHSAVKNMQLDFRDEYGNKFIDTILFPKSILRKYESLSLRSGGHRPDCLPRDDFSSDLFSAIPIDHSEYEFVNVYINGEYWGIHALKERMNADYISNKYNIDANEIVVLENAHDVNYGSIDDEVEYYNLIEFAQSNDLNVTENYNHIDSLIDIENFTNYICSQIFIGNADWPNSNVKYWKKRTSINQNASFGHDGKWRWLLYDIDGGFGGTCNDVFYTFNSLVWAHQTSQFFEEYTKLIIGLMNSNKFRVNYINRMSDLLNSSFLPSVTLPKLQTVFEKIDPEMLNHINRWRYPSNSITLIDRLSEIPSTQKWEYLENKLDSFLIERPHYIRLHMINLWNLLDSSKINLNVNSYIQGQIKINSIQINEELEGVNQNPYPWEGMYFKNIDIPLKAIPNPGYRFVEWLETHNQNQEIIINVNTDTIFTAIFEIDPNYIPESPLKINEILAQNTSYNSDEYDEFDDWIEIYNPNSFEVNLKNYYLTDDKENLIKYKISNDFIVPANGFQLFWCDDQAGQGINHTNFKLSAEGEFVALTHPNKIFIFDSISFNEYSENISFGREYDGANTWINFNQATPKQFRCNLFHKKN
jgi:hypothetical protein